MDKFLFVRPAIISEVFTNLAAGWFGLLLISPNALVHINGWQTAGEITKAIISGILCLLIAEHIARQGNYE